MDRKVTEGDNVRNQIKANNARRNPNLARMAISVDESWVLANKCPRCRKPVIYTGKCYECAKGNKRTYRRPLEDLDTLTATS